MKILLFLATAAFGLGIASAAADECPTKENAKKGFIVERGARSKTEVFHSGDSEVRTVSK
jgi:hypothetical protein